MRRWREGEEEEEKEEEVIAKGHTIKSETRCVTVRETYGGEAINRIEK